MLITLNTGRLAAVSLQCHCQPVRPVGNFVLSGAGGGLHKSHGISLRQSVRGGVGLPCRTSARQVFISHAGLAPGKSIIKCPVGSMMLIGRRSCPLIRPGIIGRRGRGLPRSLRRAGTPKVYITPPPLHCWTTGLGCPGPPSVSLLRRG